MGFSPERKLDGRNTSSYLDGVEFFSEWKNSISPNFQIKLNNSVCVSLCCAGELFRRLDYKLESRSTLCTNVL